MTKHLVSLLALLSASCSLLDAQVGPWQPCTAGAPAGYGATAGYGDAGLYGSSAGSYPGTYPAGTGGASDAGSYSAAPSPAIYGKVTGNLLIADQYNDRVIELTRAGELVWSFGDGSNVPGPRSVVAPNDAERLPGGRTLIAATGAPAGGDPACPAAGCPDNRVIIVDDQTGAIVWQYGAYDGKAGHGPDELHLPVSAVLVPASGGDDILITDQWNNRVIEVSEATKDVVWQFPPKGSKEKLSSPNSAERILGTDRTLISDFGGNRVIEVDHSGAVTWQYPDKLDPKVLNGPSFATRLANRNTLITDTNNNRIVEIDSSTPPKVVWNYSTASRSPCQPAPLPTHAVRLSNNDTLIADQFNDQVVEVDHWTPPSVVYTYGRLGVWGSGPGLLWAPYDAKVVGDYTGLTPPDAGP